jgi:RNA polymerase sigma-70 factor (ECF subfamily)
MGESDENLAVRAQQGDGKAFHSLLERNYDLIYRFAYRFMGQRADAEDIAQDVCATLADRILAYRGRSRFSTWLYAVTLNCVRDHGRRRRTIATLQGSYAMHDAHRRADWDDTDRRTRWLYAALDQLEPGLKETALLVIAEDMTHSEASQVLGVKESTVSWRMSEVKKRLKAVARHD